MLHYCINRSKISCSLLVSDSVYVIQSLKQQYTTACNKVEVVELNLACGLRIPRETLVRKIFKAHQMIPPKSSHKV